MRQNRAALEPDPEAALKRFEDQGLFRIPDIFYQQPIFYKANRLTVVGPDENILWPQYAEDMDFELEFGFFIGTGGKNIKKDDAHKHIFGYSIFNDISARDAQAIEMPGGLGPGKGKDFDTSNVIGPCIVTADELDPYNCTMEKSGHTATPAQYIGRSKTLLPTSRARKHFTPENFSDLEPSVEDVV